MAQFMTSHNAGMGFSSQHGAGTNDQWTITTEERKGYDKQFDQLNPRGGFVSGDQARSLFLKSNLSPAVLGQIWELADMTGDGKMDKKEFAIAMKLIKSKLQGKTIPSTLPTTLKQQSAKFDISSFAQTSFTSLGSTGTSSVFGSITPTISPATTSTGFSSTPSINMGMKTNTISNGTGGMGGFMAPGAGMLGTLQPNIGKSNPPMMPMMGQTSGMPLSMTSPMVGGLNVSGFQGPMPISGPVPANTLPVSSGVGSNSASDWDVPKPSKLKYNQLFNSNDSNKTGFLSGMQARHILTQTGLPQPLLAQIWNLSDLDKDGRLTQEEFVLAMHLTDVAKSGTLVPAILPPNLIPPSYRRATGISGSNLSSAPMSNLTNLLEPENALNAGKENEPSSFTTFEDKRRDNFNKGNLELERRRLALEESQRKERERLEQKEREQRERREKERQEQERRKQAELERQLEKQRAAEREREEARRKAIEQQEAARREMERQRQLEWERIKRQELLQQKLREQEVVTGLHAKTKELDVEITALQGKKEQLGVRVSDVEAREREQKLAIDAMNKSRDLKIAAVAKRQEELKGLNNILNAVVPEKQNVTERMSNLKENINNTGTYSSLKSSSDARRVLKDELQANVNKNRQEAASKLQRLEKLNTELNHLREELNKHRLDVEVMNRVQQDKVRDLQEARRAKEASLMRKNSMEKIKRQRKSAAESFVKMKELAEVGMSWDQNQNKLHENKSSSVAAAVNIFEKEKESTVIGTKVLPTERKIAEDEIKKEDVKRRIAEMQQKRLEQKKMQEPVYSAVNKPQPTSLTTPAVKTQSAIPNTISVKTGSSNLPRFRVLYAFQARNPDELSIKEGDIVLVNENDDTEPGWYSGTLNDKKGWFPVDYVEKIIDSSSTAPPAPIAKDLPKSSFIQPPPQSAKPNRLTPSSDTIQSSEKSAFSAMSRTQDASPIPGKGQQIEGLKCKALYPWQAKKENHLTFEKDSIIVVSEQQAMWWFGSCLGKTGWFPKSYVKEISSTPVVEQTKTSPAQKRKAPIPPQNTAAQSKPTESSGKEYVANYTFSSTEEGDLNFEVGEVILVTQMDGDWWTGSINSRTGIFPANYVTPKEKEQVKPAQATAATASSGTREIANVIAAYTASAPNQLSLKMGQLVLIKKKNDSGWWEGELQARGKKKQIGWFPANYVKVRTSGQTKSKAPTPKPTVLCQVMAMYDYTAQNDDEITFTRGALISVTDKSDQDWWKGFLKTKPNTEGLFPRNYVREIGPNDTSASSH